MNFANAKRCPYVGNDCIKPNHGACTLEALADTVPVICCPNRLYASGFRAVLDVASIAFPGTTNVLKPADARTLIQRKQLAGGEVVGFGKYYGQELPLPGVGAKSTPYYMDWVLASLNDDGTVREMTALEVQTIDTTGSYREQSDAAFAGRPFTDKQGRTPGYSNSGFNWENVSKRILPQVIYKGHALRREIKCTKGLFFACPVPVLDRIMNRLGGAGTLHQYPMGPGTITFLGYQLGQPSTGLRQLVGPTTFTTTVDQIALAFTSPRNLPPSGVYEQAANAALSS